MTDTTKTAGADASAERKLVTAKQHTLLVPINRKSDGEKVTEVVMRRPKGKELRNVNRLTEAEGVLFASFQMIADLSGLTLDDVDEMDGEDVIVLAEMVTDFLPKVATGEQS